jgi:peptide/nickel transport system substrate-binding protein
MKLVRNPHYWVKGKPYLDSVTFTNVPDDNQRILQLKSGQAQINRFPPFSAMQSLSHTPNIVATPFAGTRVDYLLLNERVKPYDDVHVRRAISYAIDRSALIKAVLFGNGKPADSFLSPSDLYYRGNPQLIRSDMAKAKQEMAASSVPHGFSTTYLTAPPESNIAEIIQQQLAPLGIRIKIKTVDENQVFDVQGKGDYEMTEEYWTQDIPDPDERTAWFLNESASKDYFTAYHNPEMTRLVTQSERVADPAKRAQIYARMQELHAQDLPQIPLYYSPYQYAYSSRVHGFTVSPLGNYHLENVWLK